MLPTAAAIEAWSKIINLLIQTYFQNTATICIIWSNQIEFQLRWPYNDSIVPIVSISKEALAVSFERDIQNFSILHKNLAINNVRSSDLEEKLTISIEKSFCEGFLAFQADIPIFARAFYNASRLSIWRSQRSRFIFGYMVDEMIAKDAADYFTDYLFIDQPNVLVIEAANMTSTNFNIKTNKFVGSKQDHPEALYLLNRFDAVRGKFETPEEISTEKLRNLQGREVVLGCFDYKPFTVVDYEHQPQVRDYAADNPKGSVYIDGAEARYLITFCELYNCSFQFDSSEKKNWGYAYPNYTSTGLINMIIERKSEMALGAFYFWLIDYEHIDMSAFLGRSGVTCLVPAPKTLTSWNLPLKPFGFTLWIAVGACLILETLSLMVTRRMEQTIAQGNNSWTKSLQFGYATSLKLFINQASQYVVKLGSLRTILFACYMIDIIITSIYGGELASFLTLPKFGEAADSVERLHKFQLLWTGTSTIWVIALWDAKDEPIMSDLYANFRVHTFEEMHILAKTEDMGFVLERMEFGHFGNSEFLTQESLDRLKLMVDDIYFDYTTALVPRLWAFLHQFDMLIYNWHSSGLDKYWEWKVTADFANVNQQDQIERSRYTNFDRGPVSLGLSNFAGLILVWFVGITASTLVFCIEVLYFYKWQHNSIKQNTTRMKFF